MGPENMLWRFWKITVCHINISHYSLSLGEGYGPKYENFYFCSLNSFWKSSSTKCRSCSISGIWARVRGCMSQLPNEVLQPQLIPGYHLTPANGWCLSRHCFLCEFWKPSLLTLKRWHHDPNSHLTVTWLPFELLSHLFYMYSTNVPWAFLILGFLSYCFSWLSDLNHTSIQDCFPNLLSLFLALFQA